MRLLLKRVDGTTLALDCDANDTVSDVKRQIESREGIPCSVQSLSYGGSYLNDEDALEDICSSDLANFDLNVDLLGGAKKRKKKVYTTPKKIKKKPKKVKLATLKFYSVCYFDFTYWNTFRLTPPANLAVWGENVPTRSVVLVPSWPATTTESTVGNAILLISMVYNKCQ